MTKRDWSSLRIEMTPEEEQEYRAKKAAKEAEREAMMPVIDDYNQIKICEFHMSLDELRDYVAKKGYEDGIGVTEKTATQEERTAILRKWRIAKIVLETREKEAEQ